MFNNVGGKIKAVAKVTAWIGIAICVKYMDLLCLFLWKIWR